MNRDEREALRQVVVAEQQRLAAEKDALKLCIECGETQHKGRCEPHEDSCSD